MYTLVLTLFPMYTFNSYVTDCCAKHRTNCILTVPGRFQVSVITVELLQPQRGRDVTATLPVWTLPVAQAHLTVSSELKYQWSLWNGFTRWSDIDVTVTVPEEHYFDQRQQMLCCDFFSSDLSLTPVQYVRNCLVIPIVL